MPVWRGRHRRPADRRHRPAQHDAAAEPAARARPALPAAHRQTDELHPEGGRGVGGRQAGTIAVPD